MKKATITFLTIFFVFSAWMRAQTIPEGINHLYAKRDKSAEGVFKKLLEINPNNLDAIYWLGQTYFNMDDNAAARQVYEKALATNGSAPLILVGIGHADLLDNKANDARQHFDAALAASHTSKGDDPIVQTAIGRAIVDSKTGDFNYAIQLLEAATLKDPKNTETLLQLGNAYRKANPGEGGGEAFKRYKKALEVNPNFAAASLRLAKLFESQKNWEFVLQYLNEAVVKDSRFSDAYYELFYYFFYRGNYPEAEVQLNKFIESKTPETDPKDQFLYAQLCWARKDFNCAVDKAENVVSALGDKTKPKVYRLLTDADFQKGDYVNAKKYSDLFFQKRKSDDITIYDYQLRADIIGKTGGTDEEVLNTYLESTTVDTLANLKIDLLKKGIVYFRDKKVYDKQTLLITKMMDLKPKPTINDYFDLMKSYYDADNYGKSRDVALLMRDQFADQVYGYDWSFKNAARIDTVKRDSIAIPDAQKLYEFSQKDTVKFRNQYFNSVRFLGGYYYNARDKENALVFLQKWHDVDSANASAIQGYIESIKKMSSNPPGTKPPGANPKGTTTPKTGNSKTAAAKKPKPATKKAVVKN